jgi:RNA polymerase sigma factor (sigma-70 family)
MAAVSLTGDDTIEPVLLAQRPRLVRLCARLSGDPAVAEDLAQETLLEAWRHADKLTDPSGAERWLAAVARNVCLRWRRAHGREAARLVPLITMPGDADEAASDIPAGEDDLALELERDDLARLLDRAMAALAPETRQILIARCIEEMPQAEAAARLGLSEGALAVRLHRGKLALRRILEGELHDDASSYGMPVPEADGWQVTRMWCLFCGQRRLRGYLNPAACELILRCPACHPSSEPALFACHHVSYSHLFDGVTGHKTAFNRVLSWGGPYYRGALRAGYAICQHCRYPAPLRMGYPDDHPLAPLGVSGAHVVCARCNNPNNDCSLDFLILALPEGRRFWREHPRLRVLPERAVESEGREAVVAGYESIPDGARLEVVAARSNFDVLGVHTSRAG